MTIDHTRLAEAPRILMEAKLNPLQGNRFQPTGFADLGPARYTLPDGTEMLLLESAQSVANRMELACWDDAADDLIADLRGLPYIRVNRPDGSQLTNSVLEAHRINSPYILEGMDKRVFDLLKVEAAGMETGPVRIASLAKIVFKYDANAVLHGVFLAKSDLAGGRLRLTRLLSGFIEARDVRVAESGGVKNDRVDPSGNTKQGFGNVPFHRTEFTAQEIKAYFNLDLALLRGYGLNADAGMLLIALALLKVRRFLSKGLRLRTACDLDHVGNLEVLKPKGFEVPEEKVLLDECKTLIGKCKTQFADPPVTPVTWAPAKKQITIDLPVGTSEPVIPDDLKTRVKWKRATKKSGPKIELLEGIDEDLVASLKDLLGDNREVAKAIDKAVAEQSKEHGKGEEGETSNEGDE